MSCWLNIHWPPLNDEEANAEWRYWVFLQRPRGGIEIGDRVFIYETFNNPDINIDGREGRKGIVALVEVESGIEPNEGEVQRTVDGREIDWRFHIQTRVVDSGRLFCSLPELRGALGLPGFCAQVPGGLMHLNDEQCEALSRCFT